MIDFNQFRANALSSLSFLTAKQKHEMELDSPEQIEQWISKSFKAILIREKQDAIVRLVDMHERGQKQSKSNKNLAWLLESVFVDSQPQEVNSAYFQIVIDRLRPNLLKMENCYFSNGNLIGLIAEDRYFLAKGFHV